MRNNSGTWSVRADIDACLELELVLPARKEAVESPFVDEMRNAASLAIYRAMAVADPAPRIACTDHKRAADAGIDMPVPPPELRPWRPGTADIDDWRAAPAFAPVRADSLVMAFDPEPQDAQAFWRAAERAGIAARLFEGDTRFEGYAWYDALPRVRDLRIDITEGSVTHPLGVLRVTESDSSDTDSSDTDSSDVTTAPGFPDTLSRPDAIHMHLRIQRCSGPPETMTVPADLAFVGEGWTWLSDARPLVTGDSGLDPSQLRQLLRAAFFAASDDAEADSYTTQRDRFDEEAIHIATTLLCSEDEARKCTIAEAVLREIFWVMPRDREVSITVANGRVSVAFAPEPPTPAGAVA